MGADGHYRNEQHEYQKEIAPEKPPEDDIPVLYLIVSTLLLTGLIYFWLGS